MLLFLVLFAGCGGKETEYIARKPVTYVKKEPETEKKEERKYVYRTRNIRNPFIPPGIKSARSSKVGELDLSMLELKGIMKSKDGGGKYALIAGPGGKSYIIKGTKLIGLDNKVVQGVSGTIKDDRVILVTKRQYMRVLKIKNKKSGISLSDINIK